MTPHQYPPGRKACTAAMSSRAGSVDIRYPSWRVSMIVAIRSVPDVAQAPGIGRGPHRLGTLHIREHARQVVVAHFLGIAAGLHVLPHHDGHDAVVVRAVVLVPSDDQQAVVAHGPV